MVGRWLAALALAGALGGCGGTRKNAVCPDKSVVEACSPGFMSHCETDGDGCERCSCVPITDDQGRPGGPY